MTILTILYSLPFLIIGLCDFQDDYADEREAKRNLDELTRLLCEAGKVYRGEKLPSDELLRWWMNHKRKDEKKL
jgi:hypothetical protein